MQNHTKRAVLVALCLVVAVVLALLPTPALADDVDLRAAALHTYSNTQPTAETWATIATADVSGSGLSIGDKVLVIASFESTEAKQLVGSFRVRNNNTSAESTTFQRELSAGRATDWGIGSIVHIFNALGTVNDQFILEHKTDSNEITSSGTIIAIPLVTTTSSLNYGEKYFTDGDEVIGGVDWEEVGGTNGCRTGNVTLRVMAHIFVAASIECQQGSGGTETGQWKLQYSTDNFASDTNDLDYTVSRYTDEKNDKGLISLVGLLQSQDAGTYQFRVAHKGTSDNVITNKVSLVAVGLEDGSHYFQAWKVTAVSDTTDNTELEIVNGVSTTVTPDATSANLVVYGQYVVSGSAVAGSISTYDVSVNGYTTAEQRRYLSDQNDIGSGGSVGMTAVSHTSYTMNLRHAISTGTLTTTNAVVVGFITGYATGTPPLPELATFILKPAGLAVIIMVFLVMNRRARVTSRR